MVNEVKVVRSAATRKEMQDKIRAALANKPTGSSLLQRATPMNKLPMTAQKTGSSSSMPTVLKKKVKSARFAPRPVSVRRQLPATFEAGEHLLYKQLLLSQQRAKGFETREPFAEGYSGTFKHSGDMGDLWYSLPVMRHMGSGTLYLALDALGSAKQDGTPSGLSKNLVEMMKPLLLAQPYVDDVKIWQGEKVDIDMDIFRTVNMYGDINLCELILMNNGVPFSESETPWLSCGMNPVASTVFARSPRYHNNSVNYKDLLQLYGHDAVFVGLPEEHELFEKQVGHIRHYRVRNFLEMAEIINGSDLFIGNQSSPMAIAVGLGKAFIQEVCRLCPNCMFQRENSRYIL